MNIQTKTILTITSVSTALIAIFVFIIQTVLLDGFLALERNQVQDHTRRVQNMLSLEQDNLQRLVSDWGVWSDAYRYMHDLNRQFVISNLESTTFAANAIDTLLYIRHNGTVVYGRQYDETNDKLRDIDPQLLKYFKTGSPFLDLHHEGEKISGILTTDNHTYLVAVSPILNSDGSGKAPGVIMMSRIIDDEFISALVNVLKLDISFYQNQQFQKNQDLIDEINQNDGFLLQVVDEQRISGFGLRNDISGNLALIYKVTMNRAVYQQWLITNRSLIIAAVIIALSVILLTVLLIRKVVINKIAQIIRQLKQMQTENKGKDYISSGDEISYLNTTINELVEDLKKNASELGNAKDDADKSNKIKTQFLSQLSHELRTPLNAIIGFAELSKTYEMDVDNIDNIDHILTAGQHLLGLIEDLLDLTKLEMGKFDIRNEDINLEMALLESVQLIETLAYQHGVNLHNECYNMEAIYIHADNKRFKQIIINLLSNAIKYNKRDGNVWVRCQQMEDKTMRVSIEDDGVGISQENIGKIFEPYERGDANNTFIAGSGIGLALTRELVTAMNGNIGVESEQGKGSRFWVEFTRVNP